MGLFRNIVVLKKFWGKKGHLGQKWAFGKNCCSEGIFGLKMGLSGKINVLKGFGIEKRLLVRKWGFYKKSMF